MNSRGVVALGSLGLLALTGSGLTWWYHLALWDAAGAYALGLVPAVAAGLAASSERLPALRRAALGGMMGVWLGPIVGLLVAWLAGWLGASWPTCEAAFWAVTAACIAVGWIVRAGHRPIRGLARAEMAGLVLGWGAMWWFGRLGADPSWVTRTLGWAASWGVFGLWLFALLLVGVYLRRSSTESD
ncbi:MAG: hypothetical protein HYZ53_04120 [Planctomycetes bacterium]|nr:hypothetical protein [Planctomycetota bacterium]